MKRGIRFSLAFLALGIVAPVVSRAADDRWTPLGPYGGDIRAIAVSPSHQRILYVGTNYGGVFKSVDSGLTWQGVNGGLTKRDVRALAIDPRSPNVVYVGLADGGIFKTADGGSSWAARNEGLGTISFGCEVSALAVDPFVPETVYAGVCGNGVYKSVNGGATWTEPPPASRFADALALALDPSRPGTLYAGGFGGIAKSTDSAETWQSLPHGSTVFAVAIDPTSPDIVYGGSDGGVVSRSGDGGATWVFGSLFAIPGDVRALAIDPIVPTTIYAATSATQLPGGLFRSTDSGSTWAPVEGVAVGTVAALASSASPYRLFAGALAQGVLSSDNGLAWTERNAGLNAVPVTAVGVDASDRSRLYVSRADLGISLSRDGGSTWEQSNAGLPLTNFQAVTADPEIAGIVLAGSIQSGLFKSDDHGQTWAQRLRGIPANSVLALAATASPPTIFAGMLGLGVLRSTDSGEGWIPSDSAVGQGSAPGFAFDPSDPSTIYTPTFTLPGPCPLGCPIPPGRIARSTDGGETWTSLSRPDDAVAVAVDPSDPSRLYAGVRDEAGVFVSVDGGQRWVRKTAGLQGASITALATSAGPPSVVYAGSAANGIFVSTDGGESWSPFSTGLLDRRIRFLTRAADGVTLFAGTHGGGLHVVQIARPACSGRATPCRRPPIVVAPRQPTSG